ncbi:unnamed protein product [Brassica oleracea var. botrytis]
MAMKPHGKSIVSSDYDEKVLFLKHLSHKCDVAAMVNASEVKHEPAQCLFSLKLPNCKSMPLDTRQRDLPPQLCFEDNAS